MNELNNKIIAENISESLYWLVNHGGLTTVNMTYKIYYYYKLSNKDKQKEPFQTICDNTIDSLEDFYKVIELVEENTENDIQIVKEQAIIDVEDFSKDLYVLVKLREE
jgi:hypothetical protein